MGKIFSQTQQTKDSLLQLQKKQYGDIDVATSTPEELSAQQDFGSVATPGQFEPGKETRSLQDIHSNNTEGIVIGIILLIILLTIIRRIR